MILILVLTGVRTMVFRAVPPALKAAIAVGIGLFITLIGLVDAGFVRRVPDAANTTVPVGLGIDGSIASWPPLVFVIGLLITGILVAKRVRGGILIGVLTTTVIAIVLEAIVTAGRRTARTRRAGTRRCPTRSPGCRTCRCWAT